MRKYKLGIVIDPVEENDERFRGMLAIPYLTRGGVKAIRFRNLKGGKPKFAQPEGQPIRLYNVAAYFTDSEIIGIAEGEIDAIAATECLGIPTVGIPGSTQWAAKAKIWTPIFKDYPMAVMFADGDPVDELTGLRPGRELARTVGQSLKWRLRTVEMPEGEDVSSMIAANRIDEIHIPKVEVDDGDDS